MTILVLPANTDMMKHLRHPDREVRRFVDMDTPVEWPNDQFTIRRLQGGDIMKTGDVPAQGPVRTHQSRFKRK